MSTHHDQGPVDQDTLDTAATGCAESRLLVSRRAFLGVSTSFCSWAFMPKIAEASGMETRLLVVILRGGIDGLHVAVPKDSKEYGFYAEARQDLALRDAELVSLNDQFWLNSTMVNFHRMYNEGDAALITSIAPPLRNRSHFQCLNNLENGLGDTVRFTSDGWLNRLLRHLPRGEPVRTRGAIAVTRGSSPLILSGEEPVLSWSPANYSGRPAPFDQRLADYYEDSSSELSGLLARAGDIDGKAGNIKNVSVLQRAFTGAGRLLARDDGPRIAVLSVDNWDTHSDQRRPLTNRLRLFDEALQTFRNAVGTKWQHTVVACVSEFGRTAYLNGTSGTDHGIGTVAFLLGGAVAGGKVHGQWRAFDRATLVDQRDLQATSDTRQLFKGLLQDHLGVGRTLMDNHVFPESAGVTAMPGLVKTAQPAMMSAGLSARSMRVQTQNLPARSAIGRFRKARKSRA